MITNRPTTFMSEATEYISVALQDKSETIVIRTVKKGITIPKISIQKQIIILFPISRDLFLTISDVTSKSLSITSLLFSFYVTDYNFPFAFLHRKTFFNAQKTILPLNRILFHYSTPNNTPYPQLSCTHQLFLHDLITDQMKSDRDQPGHRIRYIYIEGGMKHVQKEKCSEPQNSKTACTDQ